MKKLLIVLGCLVGSVVADVDISKVHVVDYTGAASAPKAVLFRGNTPLSDDGLKVDFDQWYDTLVEVGKTDIGASIVAKEKAYLVDFGFEDAAGLDALTQFFAKNPSQGKYLPWDITPSADYPPTFNTSAQIAYVTNSSIWSANPLPTRVEEVFKMLLEGPPAGYSQLIVYGHCASGWNKIGTFIDVYRISHFKKIQQRAGGIHVLARLPPAMKGDSATLSQMYSKGCQEGARCPVKPFTAVVGWYCIWSNVYESKSYSDCTTAYTCDEQSTCLPTQN